MSVQIATALPSDWVAYRELRQQRLAGATTYLAVLDGDRQAPIGTVTGLATHGDDLPVVAMYVVPDRRGSGCAHPA